VKEHLELGELPLEIVRSLAARFDRHPPSFSAQNSDPTVRATSQKSGEKRRRRKIGATEDESRCQTGVNTDLLDNCGEHPALGNILGEGPGLEVDRGRRFVVVYDLRPSVMDLSVAARMSSLCAFER
jgi:hypothetical protein